MSTFEVKVYKLRIEEHPNADSLELAVVGDYRSIVMKGQYKTGDLGVYIPEASVLPDWVIERLGLEGRLAGKAKNRVKAVKLRGILSQGLIYPIELRENVYNTQTRVQHDIYVLTNEDGGAGISVTEGGNVQEYLGITKYEPVIPAGMNGEVFNAFGYTLKYDIENIKRHPDILENGEFVSITEKLHGTWCCIGYHPEIDHPIITSKGQSEKGLAFKMNAANVSNLYIRAYRATQTAGGEGSILTEVANSLIFDNLLSENQPFYLIGEIFGVGVQDLHYGLKEPQLRLFDIYVGNPGEGRYLNVDEFQEVVNTRQIPAVPELWQGSYDESIIEEFTNGKDTLSGTHVREGIVIKPIVERRNDEIGRVFLKSVSEGYLLRKGKKGEKLTEFN